MPFVRKAPTKKLNVAPAVWRCSASHRICAMPPLSHHSTNAKLAGHSLSIDYVLLIPSTPAELPPNSPIRATDSVELYHHAMTMDAMNGPPALDTARTASETMFIGRVTWFLSPFLTARMSPKAIMRTPTTRIVALTIPLQGAFVPYALLVQLGSGSAWFRLSLVRSFSALAHSRSGFGKKPHTPRR